MGGADTSCIQQTTYSSGLERQLCLEPFSSQKHKKHPFYLLETEIDTNRQGIETNRQADETKKRYIEEPSTLYRLRQWMSRADCCPFYDPRVLTRL